MICKKCNEPLDMNDIKAALDYPYMEISFTCKSCKSFNYALINQDAFIVEEDEEGEDE